MTSLDDLIRATLAARAHDVDGLVVDAPAPAARPARRWVAIGAVGVLAAAVLAAVVVLAPWRGPTTRDAAPAGPVSPPAGLQWVSYHGITLTVPAGWDLQPTTCGPPATDAVTVEGPLVATPSCPAPVGPAVQGTTQVMLGSADQAEAGGPLTVGGHPALRGPLAARDRPWSSRATWPVETRVDLPDVGVELIVATTSEQRVRQILDAIEYLPVDHLGCAARTTTVAAPANVATLAVPASGAVTVCEYGPTGQDTAALVGSRLLRPSEAESIRSVITHAPANDRRDLAGLGSPRGLLLYRFSGPDGVTTVEARRGAGSVDYSQGDRTTVIEGADVPVAYPTG